MNTAGKPAVSAWHEGELEVQRRAGVRDEADQLTGMYKRELPAGIAGFLGQQQFAVLSTADSNGRMWASLLAGSLGMIEVRGPNSVALVPPLIETGLPAAHIEADPQLGMIAIDFSRRIRVRINGHARVEADGSILITTDQVYGNCSQYIQRRVLESPGASPIAGVTTGDSLSLPQVELIHRADTFFIASRHPELGADASHRGGKPGFVRIESPSRISFPDYSGNNMFNTLGNLGVNPAIGLLFVDFESGRTLQVTGRAHIDWDSARASGFDLAKRVVDVDIDEVVETEHATSLRYRFIGYSPTLG